MSTPKQRAWVMILYGVFLVGSGLYGYTLTDTHSTSALFNGGVFGVLFVVLGVLHALGRAWTHVAALSATIIFFVTFLWRATLQWTSIELYGPVYTLQPRVAILLTIMASVSAVVGSVLAKDLRR